MEVIGSIYTGVTADFQRGLYPIARCVKAEQHDLGVVMAEVNVLGSLEARFESTNRIYDVGGCSPTLSTMQGGNQEPKILEAKQLGFMDNGTGKHQSNTVYDENALCPNITTVDGGGTQQIKICESQIPCELDKMPNGHLDSLDNAKICDVDTTTASTVTARYYKGIGAHKDNMCIVAMRGRNPNNPSDRTEGSPTEQRLEPNAQGMCNSLTTVQKDNLVMEKQYRIRKLTPRECGRLMGVSDEDISKMSAVNSNTQLYKQFGNSIVVDVMCAMFKNLNIEQESEIRN